MKLDIYNLVKKYDSFRLSISELHLGNAEIVGLVGNNGAGKSTFLKLILDLILPEAGEIYSNEKSISLSEHWKEYTGSFLDEDFLIQFLTPAEYISFIADLYKISDKDLKERLSYFDGFINFNFDAKKYIREYSTGNKYKIGIVSTLITYPELVVLDEPFNFLDPTSQNQLASILKNYNLNRKALILLSSHDLTHITELCSRIIIIEDGIFIKDIENLNQERTYKELKEYFAI